MILEWQSLGEKLVRAASSCVNDAVLVAPFMKAATMRRIISNIPPQIPIRCITRWRLEEIANGVSDIEVWDILSARGNSELYLFPNLHAKYYRFGNVIFVGSANVTMSALGWINAPNFEVHASFDASEFTCRDLETTLMRNVIQVTDTVANDFKSLVSNFRTQFDVIGHGLEVLVPNSAENDLGRKPQYWFPRSRAPEFLFEVYTGNVDALSKAGLQDAYQDLAVLDLPSSLPRDAFKSVVGARLLSMPLITKLGEFVLVPRRFGEIRAWLAKQLEFADATLEWQCLMRWLLIFLPDVYFTSTKNYSEIFWRLDGRAC